jgi:hypothetical protein
MVQLRRNICRIVALISRAYINEGSFQRKHGCKQSDQNVQISVIPNVFETWAAWKHNFTKICIRCTSRLGCLVAYSAEPHSLPRYEWWGETARCVAPIVRCNHCATFTHPITPEAGDSNFLAEFFATHMNSTSISSTEVAVQERFFIYSRSSTTLSNHGDTAAYGSYISIDCRKFSITTHQG